MNTTNAAVTWQVNGIAGGDSKVGTISSSGLYTVPAMLTTPAQITVTVILQADASKSTSATVSIPAIVVDISPLQPIIEVGNTMQFSAVVNGSIDQTVGWQVNGKPGGDATVGIITVSGMYAAPASVPDVTTVTISAIPVADSSKSGSRLASVVPVITIAISPASVTMPAGSTKQLAAALQGTSNASVTWDIPLACDEFGDCNPNFGSIASNGLYSAPPYPPSGTHTVTISATSTVNPSKVAFAQVTVNYSNASLGDSYAFFLRGRNAAGDLLIAGSFISDGNGHLTQGVEDIVNPPNPVVTNLPFAGSYSIQPDGRGTATFTSSQGSSTLRFLLVSGAGLCCNFAIGAREAQVIEFNSLAVAEGSIERQFGSSGLFQGVGNSADFAFGLSGSGPSGKIVAAGRFTSSAGNNGETGPISAGLEDVNNSGTVTTNESFTGSYDENTFSRGKLTLSGPFGTRNLAFYPGDESIFVIGLDPDFPVLGTMQTLFTTDFPGPLGNSVLNSEYVIERSGKSAGVPLVSLGQFNANGAGRISAGIADENASGAVSENVSFSGNYSLAATGRGTVTLTQATGDVHLTFYAAGFQGSLTAFFVQTDTTGVTGGRFGTASAPSLLLPGGFGLVFSDSLPAPGTALGLVQMNAGQFQGTADTNDSGGTLSGVNVSGVFTLAPDARGLMTIITPTRSLRFRAYSWLRAFRHESRLVGLDPSEQQLGVVRPQE